MNDVIYKGYGYWRTTRYPIGGDFCRAPEDLLVLDTKPLAKLVKGCTHTGKLETGDTVAYEHKHSPGLDSCSCDGSQA